MPYMDAMGMVNVGKYAIHGYYGDGIHVGKYTIVPSMVWDTW